MQQVQAGVEQQVTKASANLTAAVGAPAAGAGAALALAPSVGAAAVAAGEVVGDAALAIAARYPPAVAIANDVAAGINETVLPRAAVGAGAGAAVAKKLPQVTKSYPEGTYSLTNVGWPQGPFAYGEAGSIQGAVVSPISRASVAANRAAANRANALTRRTENYAGYDVQINEKIPVILGGSPTDPANKMLVTEAEHQLFNDWLRPLLIQLRSQNWWQ